MGKNFEKITHGKVGDIIYPAYNGTNGFFKRPRWILVTEVSENGRIINGKCIYNYSTIEALELVRDNPHIFAEHKT